jgi:diacylglycerol kinase family enzyme
MATDHTDRPTMARRVAAFGALLAALASIVLIVVATAASIGGILVSLVGLSITIGAAWHALVRRGMVRTVSTVVAIAGLGVIVWGLILGDFSLPRAIAIVVTTAVAVGLARVALGRTEADIAARVRALPPAPRAHRPVLLMNPRSGGGKVERFHLEDACKARGIEPVVLHPGEDLLSLAEDAVARGADVIGMAGGDGSQALVASIASKHDVSHVVIPAGTRNHFALDLGLDREDVLGALDAYTDGVERRVDLATVNGRIFVNNASMGLYAKIVQSPEYRDAKVQTVLSMLPDLLGPDAEPLDLRFVGPDGQPQTSAHMLLVSNDPYRLDEASALGTRERLDSGTLGIVSLRVDSAAEAQRLVTLNTLGQISRFPGWLEWSDPAFRVDSSGPVEVGVDGEALMLDPPLEFTTMPGALRVRVPRRAPGASPAAKATNPWAVDDLARIAFGSRRT